MINYLIVAAVIATALVLFFGVLTMARGGEFNRRYGNKLMARRDFKLIRDLRETDILMMCEKW